MVIATNTIPKGIAKSGRIWKVEQTTRSSTQLRKGVSAHLAKSYDEKMKERFAKSEVKQLEKDMIDAIKAKKAVEKLKREEQEKRRMANEYKTAVFQEVKPQKLKGMSKKQLRSIKKTAMNQNGQIELVPLWENKSKGKSKRVKGAK
jgi:threonyl-tRNA synthetase